MNGNRGENMVRSPVKVMTVAEFLLLPETKPASEFIDGRIIQKPMPQGKHSLIQMELGANINAAFRPERLVRAFSELRCSFGGRSSVPDLVVMTRERIPRDENGDISDVFTIAPDWTIEILSPDQSHTKVTKNILHCLQYGTQMGWLIDPAERSVFVYSADRSIQVFDVASDVLPVPEFAIDFQITLGDLFGWLSE
jgi:Uma2 family endonuclease